MDIRPGRVAALVRAALVLAVIAILGEGMPAKATAQSVTIVQHLSGDFCTGVETGQTFAATGAIDDSGTVTGAELNGAVHQRVLIGANGTITASWIFTSLDITETGFTATERWWIASGTDAYASLRASGSGSGSATFFGVGDCPLVFGTDVWRGLVAFKTSS